ncbi:pimeloyl-ACP methyl ester carboxylesterase [Chryseobacterium sp. 52]|uniref:alpha/beta fold hydrolase n=1 Tax=Chryseobacterium sp. 52 TaxID=2035213 RepID=UPI000C1A5EC2|nr:alpha/beta hydrolase [Chryseobacterium sp. 52]PIF44371.1 pimeloyl-ACP methyl ester carboxylesterase [Chryseobacterium sp. 52]
MKKTADINNISVCYEIFGDNNNQSIVLISGLGSQMIRWDDHFCKLLVNKGFKVIRFDNRDSGGSIFISEKELNFDKGIQHTLASFKKEDLPYSLVDMAEDVIGLLNYLGIEKVHIAGRSMGGIIAQLLGSYFPERILSLTIIMSTSLRPSLPPSDPEVMAMMMQPSIDPMVDKEGYIKQKLLFAEKTNGNVYPLDEKQETKIIEEELYRSQIKNGIFRQLLAMGSFQYDTEVLRKITAPVLVIHGTEDLIFHPDCGKDIADSITSSELILIEGMGHSIHAELYELVSESIRDLCME